MADNTGMAGKVVLFLSAQTLGLAAAQTTQLLVEPPWSPVVHWDRVTLTCQGSGTAGATTWYKDRKRWGQQGPDHFTFTESGTYGLVLQVPAQALLEGDTVTLRCSVQVGSAPVTFTWLHNGKEVAQGPVLELRDFDVGHWGTYQCMATNQLGQDGHRVFRALSPELALGVTPQSSLLTAVAVNVSRTLLFLLLLLAVIGGCHWWHHQAARKQQERAPPDPLAPPEEGEVLYTHVVVTKRAGASPHATTLQDPQVTNAELPGTQGQPREPGDIHGNVL
ncbi:low affinity immunoglobulin gamma Fc region receptor II-like [Agelaius tricolor]|uniref:low affinity immunoglobulin gamma Fc region receptor II-like n=1 Tax=Agelaius tricolor TaxID=9191 RepID=UPI0039F1A0D0